MGSLQRLSNRSLGSTSCRQFPTLILPLALLFPRTVWALRAEKTFQFEKHAKEKAANLLTVLDSDWPCTRNDFTSIHERIGNYSSEQLVRIRCHEPLLLLVQRDLLMILRLKEIMNSKDFEENKFPANFISDEKRKKLIWSTIETAANAVGFGLHGAPALADNIIFNGAAPMYDYAKYALELKHEKKAKALREQAESLFDSAGKKVSSYFSDMLLGMLYDLYAKIDFAIKAVGEGGPMITATTVFEDEVGNPLQWSPLGAGTPLHLNPDPKLQKEEKTAVTVSGNWYVRGQDKGWISIEGWVDDTSVSTKGGFLRWKGSKHLQACKEMQEPCRSKDQAVSIQEGQLFKVVTLAVSDTVYTSGNSLGESALCRGSIHIRKTWKARFRLMRQQLWQRSSKKPLPSLRPATWHPSRGSASSTTCGAASRHRHPRLSLEVCSSLEEFLRMAYSGLQPALMASQPVLPMRASPWF